MQEKHLLLSVKVEKEDYQINPCSNWQNGLPVDIVKQMGTMTTNMLEIVKSIKNSGQKKAFCIYSLYSRIFWKYTKTAMRKVLKQLVI